MGVKLAVARWREAIYSGELAPETAERLKKRMGMTPQRMTRGLNRGSRNIAKQLGYEIVPGRDWRSIGPTKTIWKGEPVSRDLGLKLGPQALRAEEAATLRHEVNEARIFEKWLKRELERAQRSPSAAVAQNPLGRQEVVPGKKKWGLGRQGPLVFSVGPQYEGYVDRSPEGIKAKERHQSRIEQRANRVLKSKNPEKTFARIQREAHWRPRDPMMLLEKPDVLPRGPFKSFIYKTIADMPESAWREIIPSTSEPFIEKAYSGHMSPELPLQDIRTTRGLPPEVQKTYLDMRGRTGELRDIVSAVGTSQERPVIPRKNISKIVRSILKLYK